MWCKYFALSANKDLDEFVHNWTELTIFPELCEVQILSQMQVCPISDSFRFIIIVFISEIWIWSTLHRSLRGS